MARRPSSSVCPTAAQSRACSCLITCPKTVTKDKRRTVREKATEYSYVVSSFYLSSLLWTRRTNSYQVVTESITYTNTIYDPILTTETDYFVSTTTIEVIPTNTQTVQCTPSIANPSFYLRATNAPAVNGHYVQAYPIPWRDNIRQSDKLPKFVDSKIIASLFYLDNQARLSTINTNGTVHGFIDYFNDFQLFTFMTAADISYHSYLVADCTLQPPSGKYAGNYKEVTCLTHGAFDNHIFQYCPLYVEYFDNGLVLGASESPTAPACQNIVLLAVPACG